MLATLTHEHFAPLVGTQFTARSGDISTLLELTEVQPAKESYSVPGATRKPFSLFFRGPEGIDFRQGSLELSHPDFPTIEIFTTPIGCKDRRVLIQAVFN